jgi:hypothetical protein
MNVLLYFWLNDFLVSTKTQRNGSYKKKLVCYAD